MAEDKPISERESIIREATFRANAVVTADVRVILATLRDLRADVKALMRYAERPAMAVTYMPDPSPEAETKRQEALRQMVKEWQNTAPSIPWDTVDPEPLPPSQHAGVVSDPDAKRGFTLAEAAQLILQYDGKWMRRQSWPKDKPSRHRDEINYTFTFDDLAANDWVVNMGNPWRGE